MANDGVQSFGSTFFTCAIFIVLGEARIGDVHGCQTAVSFFGILFRWPGELEKLFVQFEKMLGGSGVVIGRTNEWL